VVKPETDQQREADADDKLMRKQVPYKRVSRLLDGGATEHIASAVLVDDISDLAAAGEDSTLRSTRWIAPQLLRRSALASIANERKMDQLPFAEGRDLQYLYSFKARTEGSSPPS
jgi:hypothetical protein